MAFIPGDRGVRFAPIYDFSGEACQNTLWFYFAGGVPEDLDALCEQFFVNWADGVMPHLSSAVKLAAVIAQDWTSQDGRVGAYFPEAPVVGGLGGACMANNTAFCFKLRTARRGRAYRGRFYIPGIPMSQVTDNNHVAETWIEAIIPGLINAIIVDSPTPSIPVVASFRLNKVWRTAAHFEPVLGVAWTDLTLDSMRRRLPGRGR